MIKNTPPEQVKLLIKTIAQLYKLGERKDYGFDLHKDNFMSRKDGSLVINDPWVVW